MGNFGGFGYERAGFFLVFWGVFSGYSWIGGS